MQEIWKDIKNFEGLYQVSNYGNVRSLDRKVIQFNGTNYSERIYKGKILKQNISKNGYKKVILQNITIKKTFLVHRLVAEAFIPNPENKPCINHKDECKENNIWTNLEYCTQSYNINYGNRNNKVKEKLKNKPKTKEHKRKLSIVAKQRTILRDKKGRIAASKIKGDE